MAMAKKTIVDLDKGEKAELVALTPKRSLRRQKSQTSKHPASG
jgi:hypothetical protein